MPYEHYYDEEDFDDENFIDEQNLNVEFKDPYAGYPTWGGREGFEENNRMGSRPVPVYLDDGDGKPLESDYHHAEEIDGVEALAWYAPMSVSSPVGGFSSEEVQLPILLSTDLVQWKAAMKPGCLR